jgi:DNA transformation protein
MSDLDPAYLQDLFAPLGPVSVRRMFGGQGIFHEGLMVGLVAWGQVFLKADDQARPAFEAAGSQPFVYDGKGKPMQMSYWSLPEAALDDPDAMRDWAERAWAAALRADRAKPPGKRKHQV